MAGTRSKSNRKRSRPPVCASERAKRCDCGGKTGKLACKMAASCDSCGRCLRVCLSNVNFAETLNKEHNERERIGTRLETGVTNYEMGGLNLERLLDATPPSRIFAREILV